MTMARLFMAFLPFAVLGTEYYGDGQTRDPPVFGVAAASRNTRFQAAR